MSFQISVSFGWEVWDVSPAVLCAPRYSNLSPKGSKDVPPSRERLHSDALRRGTMAPEPLTSTPTPATPPAMQRSVSLDHDLNALKMCGAVFDRSIVCRRAFDSLYSVARHCGAGGVDVDPTPRNPRHVDSSDVHFMRYHNEKQSSSV